MPGLGNALSDAEISSLSEFFGSEFYIIFYFARAFSVWFGAVIPVVFLDKAKHTSLHLTRTRALGIPVVYDSGGGSRMI